MLNTDAAEFSLLADDHAAAIEQIDHRGDGFFAVAGAGSDNGDKLAEGVFGAVDFFVDVFHGSMHLINWTASLMPMFKKTTMGRNPFGVPLILMGFTGKKKGPRALFPVALDD